jgi:AraC-like DNA-binding protein
MEWDYDREYRFVCDVFRKCRVRVSEIPLSEPASRDLFQEIYRPLELPQTKKQPILQLWGEVLPQTMYQVCDVMGRCYLYFLLPEPKSSTLLLIGPYFPLAPESSRILELAELLGISPKNQKYFNEYCLSVPVIPSGDRLFVLLEHFCEHLWKKPSFSIVDVNRGNVVPASPLNEAMRNNDSDGSQVNMKAMEERYSMENELMQAVTLGQLQKENQMMGPFTDSVFEKRTADPLRNAKNYCIIMNTLLRKAAEQGGVHPIYLNRVSTDFALRIEQMLSLSENGLLMREMFRSYCRLVRNHSLRSYSLLVQKTILLIDSDLSSDLTLHTLAEHQKVSSGYLATVFKRETGKTVSQYIREKRMKHAAYLLSTTHLQVQTVALHCGIVDVQYFSKLFKGYTGKTPKEYRESAKRT